MIAVDHQVGKPLVNDFKGVLKCFLYPSAESWKPLTTGGGSGERKGKMYIQESLNANAIRVNNNPLTRWPCWNPCKGTASLGVAVLSSSRGCLTHCCIISYFSSAMRPFSRRARITVP